MPGKSKICTLNHVRRHFLTIRCTPDAEFRSLPATAMSLTLGGPRRRAKLQKEHTFGHGTKLADSISCAMVAGHWALANPIPGSKFAIRTHPSFFKISLWRYS